ncbi:hypothetical protein D8Y22_06730 [Salinadaptatus halalkaliphilus]|uniref:Small CPxCG-related zinc finger protein n=1 Tax=Salinadaptatus halalkaliphilus TaxID=2419781 RepID=A0A4S3TMZ9_9EURY|nr:HVO_2523 family zinc finger protein [Salinadaptatus halalkaliphilus]THE65621.1 hypothetical protein D8Y22_06730 [Salinadaptatus halalkaliphilus]
MAPADDRRSGSTPSSADDRTTEIDGGRNTDSTEPTCPHCEAPMFERHCKYVCPQHGVIIDCSDPFL